MLEKIRKQERKGPVKKTGTNVCNQCSIEKTMDKYYASNLSKCKECVKNNTKKNTLENPEHKKIVDKKWRDENPERKKLNDKKWRENNIERKSETDRLYRELKKNDQDHLDMMKKCRKNWKDNHYKEWISKPENKLLDRTRRRVWECMKSFNETKKDHTIKLLGCKMSFYVKWLEYLFDSRMSFDNYGSYWEIDHVIPCSKFDLSNLENQQQCFSWINTRPLEKTKNRSKNDKIIIKDILIHSIKLHTFTKNKDTQSFDKIAKNFLNKQQDQIDGKSLKT